MLRISPLPGVYKLHYVTSTWFGPGGSNNGTFHDPPLIYHLERDAGEREREREAHAVSRQDWWATLAKKNPYDDIGLGAGDGGLGAGGWGGTADPDRYQECHTHA